MAEKKFTILDLINLELSGYDALNLKCVAGRRGLSRELSNTAINRPGLGLCGFFDFFPRHRIQLFGSGEVAYLNKLYAERRTDTIRQFFTYDIPCCVFSLGQEPTLDFLEIAEEVSCAILITDLEPSEFMARLTRIFSNIFAPKKTLHGVFVEVYGVGIMLGGHSGVGKSETALELVERGHRLVADDIVEIRCVNGNMVLGSGANTLISHHMEIRGLGIINVAQLYGVGAIREQKEVQLVINLEEWNSEKIYDRIGTAQETVNLLGVEIPTIDIPVRPGRNLPIIIEAAAMNMRLRKMGYNSARDFNKNVLRWMEMGDAQAAYYGTDDYY